MKSRSLVLVLSMLMLLPVGCRESQVDQAPAAEVSDTAAASATTATTPAPGTGVKSNVIKDKSKMEWVGAKVTRDHKGGFRDFDGSIEYAGGKPSNISFTIDLNSIYSDDEKLTGHLKSPDFFDVAKYPTATFTSTSLTEAPAGTTGGATHILKGTLDLHGVQKEVTIPVVAATTGEGVRTTSEFTINRHDWGISYKGMADDLIKDNVLIKLDLMFPPPVASA